ncbi:MAG TPA: hypothetical protein VHD85_07630 [Terracidiphilus sp.]|nr:hypothetical protein [Terracidiphilus sp.]
MHALFTADSRPLEWLQTFYNDTLGRGKFDSADDNPGDDTELLQPEIFMTGRPPGHGKPGRQFIGEQSTGHTIAMTQQIVHSL